MECSIGNDRHMVAISFPNCNSYSLVSRGVTVSYLSAMLNPDIRYLNLRLLIHERGSIAAISAVSGVNEKYLSQIKNRTIQQRGRSPRGVGDDAAIRLGKACKDNPSWMDERHDKEWAAAGLTEAPPVARTELASVMPITTIANETANPYHEAHDVSLAKVQHVPLLTWDTCLMARQEYERTTAGAPTYPIAAELEGRLFALEMPDDSMQAATGPSFPPGTILIFDADLDVADREYVLFRGQDGHAHFRQYVIDVGRRRLHPLNPRFEPLAAPEDRSAYLGVLALAVPPAIYRRGR